MQCNLLSSSGKSILATISILPNDTVSIVENKIKAQTGKDLCFAVENGFGWCEYEGEVFTFLVTRNHWRGHRASYRLDQVKEN